MPGAPAGSGVACWNEMLVRVTAELPCEQALVVVRWSLVVGRWSLVVGRWSLVVGRWSLVVGRWSLVVVRCALCVGRCALCVVRCAVCVVRCAVCGVRWTMDGGRWTSAGKLIQWRPRGPCCCASDEVVQTLSRGRTVTPKPSVAVTVTGVPASIRFPDADLAGMRSLST